MVIERMGMRRDKIEHALRTKLSRTELALGDIGWVERLLLSTSCIHRC
jgi:hypothetical protein